jgi:hypothetical protein
MKKLIVLLCSASLLGFTLPVFSADAQPAQPSTTVTKPQDTGAKKDVKKTHKKKRVKKASKAEPSKAVPDTKTETPKTK